MDIKNIISVEWLSNELSNPRLVLLDVSPESTIGGKSSKFSSLTIPGARLVDLKSDFSLPNAEFPNTVPKPIDFQTKAQELGINSDSIIIVFDNLGVYTSPRLWWLFKLMGHTQVSVLDGGLPEWIKKGYETINRNDIEEKITKGNFITNYHANWVVSYEQVLKNTEMSDFTIIDARSKSRFEGLSPEPRKHLSSGCIPNSLNLPFEEVLIEGRLKDPDELKQIFSKIVTNQVIPVFSCGSGLTACIILLAYTLVNNSSMKVYDGSWTEWAEKQQLFV